MKVLKTVRRQLHISAINMLHDCGIRFMFRYMLNKKRPSSFFLVVGNTVDTTSKVDLNHVITHGELMPDRDIADLAASAFDEKHKEAGEIVLEEGEPGSLDAARDFAQKKALVLADLHHKVAAPTIRPSATAKKFSISLDRFLRDRAKEFHAAADEMEGHWAKTTHDLAASLNAAARDGVDLCGEIDIEEKFEANAEGSTIPAVACVLNVRDTKTSSKSPAAKVAEDNDQLTCYAAAEYIEEGQLPDKVILDYLVYTPTGKNYHVPAASTRTQDDVNVFLNRVVNAVHSIQRGIFTPARADWWGCSKKWCGYFDICPYVKRPKLVQIDGSKVQA